MVITNLMEAAEEAKGQRKQEILIKNGHHGAPRKKEGQERISRLDSWRKYKESRRLLKNLIKIRNNKRRGRN